MIHLTWWSQTRIKILCCTNKIEGSPPSWGWDSKQINGNDSFEGCLCHLQLSVVGVEMWLLTENGGWAGLERESDRGIHVVLTKILVSLRWQLKIYVEKTNLVIFYLQDSCSNFVRQHKGNVYVSELGFYLWRVLSKCYVTDSHKVVNGISQNN